MSHELEIDLILNSVSRAVWLITAADSNRQGGLLATWVIPTSIDIDSPGVMISIASNHFTAELIDNSGDFVLHKIAQEHHEVAFRFAAYSGRDVDKFKDVETSQGIAAAPILDDCVSFLECRVFARLDAGDRIFFWADILNGKQLSHQKPLTDDEFFGCLDPEQLAALKQSRLTDVDLQRPRMNQWRENLPEFLQPKTKGE